jgi:flagellin
VTTIDVNYLVKGADGAASTATTTITVGTGTSYANTANGLISAINNAGLGMTASFATQAEAGVTGGGTQTGIQITGGLVSAGLDPGTTSTSGVMDPSGIPASELLTQGQTVAVSVGGSQVGSVTISPSVNTLAELASAINGFAGAPVTATVITNGDGTQSLSLADSTSGAGALSVTTTAGAGAVAPVFSVPTPAADAVALNNTLANTTGTAAVAAVDGALTVGVGSISADNTLAGTFVVTNTPASGNAVSETFVMGGSAGALSGSTYTVDGNTLADLEAAITSQAAAGVGSLGLGVAVTAGSNGIMLTGAAGDTVTADASGLTYTNTLTGATPSMTTATSAAGVATLGIDQTNSGDDTLSGSIVLSNNGVTDTFVMGAGTDSAATHTYFTANATLGNGVSSNSLTALMDTVNQQMTGVNATVGADGLTVTSATAGTDVTSSANTLTNTNAALNAYVPTLNDQAAGYSTGLLALTNSSGTAITGTIGAGDTLTGSIVLTNGAVTDTFVMGGASGVAALAAGNTGTAAGGNTIVVGGNTVALLEAAITNSHGLTGDSLNLTATDGPSGGIYLQSTTQDTNMSMSAGLAVAQAADATSNVAGVAASPGTDSAVTVAPAAGSINTTDTLTGSIVLTNTPTSGNAVTETFVMGGTSATAGLSGNVYTVNGSTLADLQVAINSQQAAGAGSLGLGLDALATTNGLALSTTTNNGNTIGVGANTLSDTSQGTYSSMTLGSFASQTDAVSGTISFSVGGSAQILTLAPGATVASMISQINQSSLGVTASWVAGSNGYGSVKLTSNAEGSAGQIATPVTSITDSTATAALSFTAAGAYDTGLSNSASTAALYDSTTGQTQATFVANTTGTSGIATISYTDGAGETLSNTDLTNQADAQAALNDLNVAITDVAAQDGYIGAQINTLNSISQVMSTQQENVVSAQNAIQATDYASATSNMSKYEILSQTGIAALAQANSVEQEVTKLLQ